MSFKGSLKFEDAEIMIDETKDKRLTRTQSAFLKLFDCPVCFERIRPPVTVCTNGHAVCKDCRKQLLTCPTCKAPFSQYKNTMIDQIIEENVFLCKYNERGCTVELKFQAMEEHEKKLCRHRTLECELIKDGGICGAEVPVMGYYFHVLREHRHDATNFCKEIHRTLIISENITRTNILKNLHTDKIFLETIKLDKAAKKFAIICQHVAMNDDSVVQLRIYHKTFKYKELVYRNVCAPVGIAEEELIDSGMCLFLDPSILNNFATDDILTYSIKIDNIPKNWFQAMKDKVTNARVRSGNSTRNNNVFSPIIKL